MMLLAVPANSADHLDSPGAAADPAADINDVYVFRSLDPAAVNASRTVFVMTVVPLADETSRFSTNVSYEFRIKESGTDNQLDIVCTASGVEMQEITCTGPSEVSDSVMFNAVEPGNALLDNMRIFAGLRDDPFFFDLDAFNTVVGDPAQVGLLVDEMGTDFFAGLGALTIVVDVKNEIFGLATRLEVQGVTVRNGLDRSSN
ncbi:MAG: DUF4331 family protein [Bradymonadia bacterium]